MYRKASLTSGYAVHVAHAVFLVLPKNEDVVSHPVNA